MLQATGQDHITLIDPALARWQQDPDLDWRHLLPGLPEDQRVAEDASAFCDALLRAYLTPFRQGLRQLVSGFDPQYSQRVGTTTVLSALETADGVYVLRWLRDSSWNLAPGTSALTPVTASVLIAAGALLCADWSARAVSGGMLIAQEADGGGPHEAARQVPLLMVAVQGTKSGAAAANEARRRVIEARSQQQLEPGSDVVAIVGGHIGNLGLEEVPTPRGCSLQQVLTSAADILGETPDDLIAEPLEGHLIDAAHDGRVIFVNAALVGEVEEAS